MKGLNFKNFELGFPFFRKKIHFGNGMIGKFAPQSEISGKFRVKWKPEFFRFTLRNLEFFRVYGMHCDLMVSRSQAKIVENFANYF